MTAAGPTAGSHAPFAFVNRAVNPVLAAVLRSPAHPLLSRRLALIGVTGRRSGRSYTIPVLYRQGGDTVTIAVQWPERKRWWRNLRGGADVELLVRGVRRTGHASIRDERRSSVVVDVQLGSAGRR